MTRKAFHSTEQHTFVLEERQGNGNWADADADDEIVRTVLQHREALERLAKGRYVEFREQIGERFERRDRIFRFRLVRQSQQ